MSHRSAARLRARAHSSQFKPQVAGHLDRAFVSLELARKDRKKGSQNERAMEHYSGAISLFLTALPLITDERSDELVRNEVDEIMKEAEALKAEMTAVVAVAAAAVDDDKGGDEDDDGAPKICAAAEVQRYGTTTAEGTTADVVATSKMSAGGNQHQSSTRAEVDDDHVAAKFWIDWTLPLV